MNERELAEQQKRKALDLPVTSGVYLTHIQMPDSSIEGLRARGVPVGESLVLIKDPSRKFITVLDEDDREYEGAAGLRLIYNYLKAEAHGRTTSVVDPGWAEKLLADQPTTVAPAAPADSAETDAALAKKLKLPQK